MELVRYLFTIPRVTVFFSRRICQDPLEKFFGCQRQIGRTHDNTTVKEFEKNTQALRVVNSFCRSSLKSNCRSNKKLDASEHENFYLPKRKRKRCEEGNSTFVDAGIKLKKNKCYVFKFTCMLLLLCYYLTDPIVRTVFSDSTPSTAEPMSYTNTDTNDCIPGNSLH